MGGFLWCGSFRGQLGFFWSWAVCCRRPIHPPVLFCALVLFPAWIRRPDQKPHLTGEAGYAAIDIETGQVLEQHNGNKGFAPASVTKTITALYALDTLGPEFQFETLQDMGPFKTAF